jgi:hypothetical protein
MVAPVAVLELAQRIQDVVLSMNGAPDLPERAASSWGSTRSLPGASTDSERERTRARGSGTFAIPYRSSICRARTRARRDGPGKSIVPPEDLAQHLGKSIVPVGKSIVPPEDLAQHLGKSIVPVGKSIVRPDRLAEQPAMSRDGNDRLAGHPSTKRAGNDRLAEQPGTKRDENDRLAERPSKNRERLSLERAAGPGLVAGNDRLARPLSSHRAARSPLHGTMRDSWGLAPDSTRPLSTRDAGRGQHAAARCDCGVDPDADSDPVYVARPRRRRTRAAPRIRSTTSASLPELV